MNEKAKIQLIIGAILVALLPLVCYLDSRPKEKTERQLARDFENYKDSLEEDQKAKLRKADDEKELAKKGRNELLAEIRQKGYRLKDIAKSYHWDSYDTEFGESGAVVLSDGAQTVRFHITSVDFVPKGGKTYATCNSCIEYEEEYMDEDNYKQTRKGNISKAAIASESESIVAYLEQYKQLVDSSMLEK